ncbi:hypothetical protein [Amycolatopsis vastitatis]|uniref:Uncharacterized protein n=1 Tax=Amycolatopsis vastitatis TaxID=1905142 RepID=A0A229SY50_9PSEU|nr:hypothetical protein [Amycolatopsis vastitatis]OXM63782.1 hypothetical protein CF165_28995 [Amycolatopsis vastitatis]
MSSRGPRRSRRTRGRTALGRLPSTAEFDTAEKKSPLTPDERKLVLFLLVALADDRESLARTRRRLVDAYGEREGHWCAGKTPDALLHLLAKSLGQAAANPPPWDRVADIVNVAVPAARRAVVLGQAAALSARIAGEERPVRDYDGPFSVPPWIDEPVVTVEMIRDGIETGPEVACELDGKLEELNTALDAERADNWKFRSENQRLRSLLEQLLREKYPGASADTVRQLIDERLRAVITADPPHPRTLHG